MAEVQYLSKNYDSVDKPWLPFGAPNKQEYEKWNPQVCGICCLKMIGDTLQLTKNKSLYSLTMRCLELGGFKVGSDGSIQGVFHGPLLELAREYGLDGQIATNLTLGEMKNILSQHEYIILSIDKSKVDPTLSGGHLVLIHGYKLNSDTFLLHDPEPILATNGENILVKPAYLESISNRKGLIIYKK